MNTSGPNQVSNPTVVHIPKLGGLADMVFDRGAGNPREVAIRIRQGGRLHDIEAFAFGQDVMSVAKGLLSAGVRGGDRVGVMSRPRYEWTLLDFALWSLGALPVPVPHDAPADLAEWILKDVEACACIVEDTNQAMTVAPLLSRLRSLRHLWQMDTGALNELRAAGRPCHDQDVHQYRLSLTADSPATIVHTAGSMGRPKACLITHGNLRRAAGNLLHAYGSAFREGSSGGVLLYAPFQHLTTRVMQNAALLGRIPLSHQVPCSPSALTRVLRTARPAILLAETHTAEGMVAAFRETAEVDGRMGSFGLAVDVAVRYAEAQERRRHGQGGGPGAKLALQHDLFDRNVYAPLRKALGGRLRHIVLCGTGVRRRLGLLWAGVGIDVHESYGLAETTGPVALGPPDRLKHGTAGRPLPGSSLYIDSVDQIWVHGAQNFRRYVGEAGTARTPGDWIATGDIGRLDADGHLMVVGRVGDAFETAGGVRVVPLPLENEIRAHPLVVHCVVVGQRRPYPAALITLDLDAVAHWMHVSGRPTKAEDQVHTDTALQAEINRAVVAANKTAPPGSAIRTFRLLSRQFIVGHGLSASSVRPARAWVEERFKADIDALYDA